MECPNCQAEQNSDFKYCSNCGAELVAKYNNDITEDKLPSKQTSEKQMQSKPLGNVKGILIGVVIAALVFIGYLNWGTVNKVFQPKSSKNVNKFLSLMQIENPSETDLKDIVAIVSSDYVHLLSKCSYYEIESWEIEKAEEDASRPNYTRVFVRGSVKNAFGAELKRNPVFILDDKNQIVDSYNYVANQKYEDLNKSDLEVFNLVNSLSEKVKIENWSWQSDYSSYSPGRVEGKATIYNGADVSVSYVKLKIAYYDKNGKIINTDETYAVSGDDLLPGQRRIIEWSTYNCEGADKASVKLDFD